MTNPFVPIRISVDVTGFSIFRFGPFLVANISVGFRRLQSNGWLICRFGQFTK